MNDTTNTTDPNSTFYDRSEFLAATQAPEYATSARYRQEVQDKLARSYEAGTMTLMGERRTHNGLTTRTVYSNAETQAVYGNGMGRSLGADPVMAEAAAVATPGSFFNGPEEIARAMGAPQYEADPSYQDAVRNKIARSIREGFIGTDLRPLDPSKRFSR